MTAPWLATLGSFATAPAVFVTMVAACSLLALRAWSATTGLELTRQVVLLLDGAIATLLVLFFGLVVVRFITVG